MTSTFDAFKLQHSYRSSDQQHIPLCQDFPSVSDLFWESLGLFEASEMIFLVYGVLLVMRLATHDDEALAVS
jgi:hypothetical protein